MDDSRLPAGTESTPSLPQEQYRLLDVQNGEPHRTAGCFVRYPGTVDEEFAHLCDHIGQALETVGLEFVRYEPRCCCSWYWGLVIRRPK